jgi:hypothetical protein
MDAAMMIGSLIADINNIVRYGSIVSCAIEKIQVNDEMFAAIKERSNHPMNTYVNRSKHGNKYYFMSIPIEVHPLINYYKLVETMTAFSGLTTTWHTTWSTTMYNMQNS